MNGKVPCDCLNYCGDDPWLRSGKAKPCAEKIARDQKRKARTTIAERINKLVNRHGSLRNVAKIVGVEPAYLSRLRSGKKIWPSENVLKRLRLKRVSVMIEYEDT